MCCFSLHGSAMHHGWYSSHFKSVVQGTFCCVCSKVTVVQLYVDIEKTAFRSEGHQILPSAICSMPSQTH